MVCGNHLPRHEVDSTRRGISLPGAGPVQVQVQVQVETEKSNTVSTCTDHSLFSPDLQRSMWATRGARPGVDALRV